MCTQPCRLGSLGIVLCERLETAAASEDIRIQADHKAHTHASLTLKASQISRPGISQYARFIAASHTLFSSWISFFLCDIFSGRFSKQFGPRGSLTSNAQSCTQGSQSRTAGSTGQSRRQLIKQHSATLGDAQATRQLIFKTSTSDDYDIVGPEAHDDEAASNNYYSCSGSSSPSRHNIFVPTACAANSE